MSTLNHLFDLPEQICYVQCGFCTTILLVSVPCSSLSMVVTVRCGHCTSLLSVNMMKASFVPLHLLASFAHDDEPKEGAVSEEVGGHRKTSDRRSPSLMSSSDNGEEDIVRVNPTVNKPPEKRQRAPSAYNRFIKFIHSWWQRRDQETENSKSQHSAQRSLQHCCKKLGPLSSHSQAQQRRRREL
ncbi:hypothetical protein E1A91_D01G185800v1 [Gossypium mustelinum]|uniref:Axial regulator YABBY 4 n=1 Tax=Gossypium mustelinum TaxID=34275 RepID=A0A5D2W8A7_GOSMU|nr:hypothetical protein E1A91_D01G185800v1 [Gossypium mustelinum]